MKSASPALRNPSIRVLVLRLAATWLLIPLLVAVADAQVDSNGAVTFVVMIALVLVWELLAILSAVWAVNYGRIGAWRFDAMSSLLPVAMLWTLIAEFAAAPTLFQPAKVGSAAFLSFLLAPLTLFRPALDVGDVVHFVLVKPAYDVLIAQLPKDGSRYKEFNWGGMMFSSNGVVYDETDQIVLPKARRSAAWVARVKNTDLMCGTDDLVSVPRPLWSHYYLTSFGC